MRSALASLPLLVAAITSLGGCLSDDPLASSRTSLTQRMDAHHAYTYVRTSVDGWIRAGRETTVTVLDGKVTSRKYRAWTTDFDTNKPHDTESWTEFGPDVGSHTTGHPASTLPQVYDECDHDVLDLDRTKYEVTLKLDAQNLLAECSAWQKGVEDGGSQGIWLTSITFGDVVPL